MGAKGGRETERGNERQSKCVCVSTVGTEPATRDHGGGGLLVGANCKHMLAGRQWRDGLQRDNVREAVSSLSLRPCSPGIFRTLGRSVSQRKRGGGRDLTSCG